MGSGPPWCTTTARTRPSTTRPSRWSTTGCRSGGTGSRRTRASRPLFVTVATRQACTHEGGLCPPDNLNAATVASGGGREGGLPPPASRPLFVIVATRQACTHEGGLCRPDNLNAATVASWGGREGGLPPPASRPLF